MTTQTQRGGAPGALGNRSDGTTSKSEYFGHEDAAHVLRLHQRYRATLRLLSRICHSDFSNARVLDVGCGDGTMLCEYMQWGVEPDRLAGIDLRGDQIETARARAPRADLVCGCGSELPWPDDHFDIVSAYTVFSSILDDAMRTSVAAQMIRVLKPGGIILWYDTLRENPGNPDVRSVPIEEIQSLFGGLRINLHKITFLPHIARRWPAVVLELAYNLLAALPGCRSHALIAMIKEKVVAEKTY